MEFSTGALLLAIRANTSWVFGGAGALAFIVLPWPAPCFFKRCGNRPSELEAKFLLVFLFGRGALAARRMNTLGRLRLRRSWSKRARSPEQVRRTDAAPQSQSGLAAGFVVARPSLANH